MKRIIILSCVLWLGFTACSTDYTTYNELDNNMDVKSMSFMFYNTENLFDTIDDPFTRDDEFTPGTEKNWDSDKYFTKLERIAEIIDKIDDNDWPFIVGLGEVENKLVLEDLVKNQQIVNAGYDIVHFDSPDERGIDLGLLYRPEFMNITEAQNIKVTFPFNAAIKTRDILYVKAALFNEEDIHIFVNHWPSRREGEEETEPKRLYVASVLKELTNKVLLEDPSAKIVIMGDFNDYPDNRSISEVLDAGTTNNDFFNLALQLHQDGKGTINHKGDWGMIDQIIVSQNLFVENGWYIKNKDLALFYRDWLVYKDPKFGDYKPDKTFGGNNYYGGYSDHLPVSVKFNLK